MKTRTLVALFLFFSFFSHAQKLQKNTGKRSSEAVVHKMEKPAHWQVHNNHVKSSVKSPGQVIWSEDFGGGIPQNWQLVTLSGPGGFKHSTIGSQGQFGSTTVIINSTTPANGFLMIDPDGANSPGSSSNYIDVYAYAQTPAIDLSQYKGVNLEFQHFFRAFSDADLKVGVSHDGNSFRYFDLRREVPSNASSSNPLNEVIPISDIAAGESTVYLRFMWERGSSYYWMIDDVKLVEAAAHDLSLTVPYFNVPTDSTGHDSYFSLIPHRQANFDSLYPSAAIGNFGYAQQTNTQLQLTVTGPQTTQHFTSTPFTYVSNQDSVAYLTDAVLPYQGTGEYAFTWHVGADSVDHDPSDNTVTRRFEVSDTTYARDQDNPMVLATRDEGEVLANTFPIFVNDTATSLSVYLSNTAGGGTSIGSVIKLFLYGPDNFSILAQTDFEEVKRIGWQTFDIGDVPLTPGTYSVGLEVIEDSAYIAIDRNNIPKPYTVYENIGGSIGTGGDGGTWYYHNFLLGMPYLRLNVKSSSCQPIGYTISSTQTDCGLSNGSVTVTPTKGKGPFSIHWEDGFQTGQTLSNLSSGTYEAYLTDANNCMQSVLASVSDKNGPAITGVQLTHNTCGVDQNGAIDLTLQNSTGVSVLWNNGQTTQDLQNLKGGYYTVTLLDSANPSCKTIANYKIEAPKELEVVRNVRNTICNGDSTGLAMAFVKGGTPPYTYIWNTGSTLRTLSDIPAGNYRVTVSDANNCQASAGFNVLQPQGINILGGTIEDSKEQGAITNLTIVGGQPPYHYVWTGPNNFYATTLSLVNIPAQGVYTLKVSDLLDCTVSEEFQVSGKVDVTKIQASANQFSVFPNPAKSRVEVVLPDENKFQKTRIVLLDVTGKTVLQVTELGGNNPTINIEMLPPGYYLLQAHTGNEVFAKPLIIQ